MRLLVLTSDDATRSHPSRDLCCIQFIPFSHPLFPATPLIKRKWINYSMKRSKSRLVCYTHSPEQLHHSLGPVHQAPRLHKPAQQPPKLLYHLPHLHTSRQITNQILSRKLLLLHCNCKKKKINSVAESRKLHTANIPFLGRPRPLPVLDLRSLVLTLPFGLLGSPPATSPDSEKDSLVELRDEDLRRRRLALALRRASWSAFSWGVQLPFTSASFSASSSPL